jgi:predicted DNA-binding antitoxin AbrB/MazE fold protein
MTTTVEAIYENGVFRPLAVIGLQEHANVRLVVYSLDESQESAEAQKSEWQRQSELNLRKVWENNEDDVYNALLAK